MASSPIIGNPPINGQSDQPSGFVLLCNQIIVEMALWVPETGFWEVACSETAIVDVQALPGGERWLSAP